MQTKESFFCRLSSGFYAGSAQSIREIGLSYEAKEQGLVSALFPTRGDSALAAVNPSGMNGDSVPCNPKAY
jgi:hypothetical protein